MSWACLKWRRRAALRHCDLIWYRLAGETELHILVEEPMGQDHTGRHFCLAVDDVVDLRARLDAAGVTTVGDTPIAGRPAFSCAIRLAT